MRPLKLSMTAFGPFPGCEVIDFKKFGSSPLFLINGPTGAGKTTILDAICYALYGKTTGDDREGGQMRCDLAPIETLCEISFEFILYDRHFEIRRVPDQPRPKSRGDGFTEQKPEAQLTELLPDGETKLLVGSKVSDATRVIEELTGLTADQFRQVMVLPQGKFRQLLLAESAQREKIFSQLFQTGIYKKLEERLKEKAAGIRRERDAFLQQQHGILESTDSQGLEELKLELADLNEKLKVLQQYKDATAASFLRAHQDLTNGRSLDQDFNLLAQLSDRLTALDANREAIGLLKQGLIAAQRAAKLAPLFTQRDRSRQGVRDASEKLEECHTSRHSALTRLAAAELEQERLAELQQECDEHKIELQQLEQYRMQLEQLGRVRQQCTDLQLQVDLCSNYRQLLDEREQLDRIDHYVKQQQTIFTLNEKFKEVELSGRKLADLFALKRDETKRLELAWHQGQAALLAAELKTGEACPVCGSCSHPQPAVVAGELPDFQKLEACRDALGGLDEQLKSTRERYVELRTEVKKQTDMVLELGTELGQNLEQTLAALKTSIASREQQVRSCNQQDVIHLQQLDRVGLDEHTRQLGDTLAGAVRERALLETNLPTDFHQFETLETRRSKITQDISAKLLLIEQIRNNHRVAYAGVEAVVAAEKDAAQRLQQARQEEQQSLAACCEGLEKSAFDDENDYLKALRHEEDMIAMQNQIEGFNEELQQLLGARRELENKLTGLERPEVAVLEQVLNEEQQRKSGAEDNWQQVDSRCKQLNSTLQKLEANKARLDQLDAAYAVIGTLSDVAGGQTGQKVSLQRFVLSVLLDDVLIEASNRLAAMSKGRYRLLRKEDRSKGNKASGLELIVDDAYTGKVRPVATLSGGESFMAALSLALGLSEVVQAYAGGVRLDTLFIDEGFGSLDSESLDLAISTLVDLQAAGRTIGLISHVSELKEQIPLRIDVQQTRNGSRVDLVGI